MTYKRFEDLPVWQKAIELAEQVYDFTESPNLKCSYNLRDQLERASISVSNNIAEGFERGTTKELLAFIYVARGSAGEVRSMLCFMERRPVFQNLKSQISNLKSTAEACSRQLRGWAGSLQDSDRTGTRHINQLLVKQRNRNRRPQRCRNGSWPACRQLIPSEKRNLKMRFNRFNFSRAPVESIRS